MGGSGRDVTGRMDVTHAWGNNSIAFNSRSAAARRDEAASPVDPGRDLGDKSLSGLAPESRKKLSLPHARSEWRNLHSTGG